MIASIKEMEEQAGMQSGDLEGRSYQMEKLEAIATLAGGIAHQFNNALMAVVGNMDLLQLDLPGNPVVTKYTSSVRSAVLRMTHLTDQLLAYARGGKYQPGIMPVNDMVEQCMREIRRRTDPSIRFESILGKDIPDLVADPVQMQMALSALIENAKEAVEGFGHITVSTRGQVFPIGPACAAVPPAGRYACLQVEDDGKGMDQETMSRVFEPFFTTKVMGRGLSMAAVYGIVKNHGGWIWVDSEPGRGTAVRIYLPAAETRRPGVPAQQGE
jgi:two-component system, cell cycle sensor histidine kinase and response regulator CckA